MIFPFCSTMYVASIEIIVSANCVVHTNINGLY